MLRLKEGPRGMPPAGCFKSGQSKKADPMPDSLPPTHNDSGAAAGAVVADTAVPGRVDLLFALEAGLAEMQRHGVNWLNVEDGQRLEDLLNDLKRGPAAQTRMEPAKAAPARAEVQHTETQRSEAPLTAAPTSAPTSAPLRAPVAAPVRAQAPEASPSERSQLAARRAFPAGTMPSRENSSPQAEAGEAQPPPKKAPRRPPPPPAEINTLESLQVQYRHCESCGLAATRNRLVFGVGHESPRILFIGEAPGAEEDQQGLPFVGRAGQLLTGLINATGLGREDVYITNVVKCRPPGNRNPEPGEIASCGGVLKRQIELLNPGLVVVLGNVPLHFLNPGARGITSERGKTFRWGQWTVLPTFHPSYLLRNPAALGQCWSDFRQAIQLACPEPVPGGQMPEN